LAHNGSFVVILGLGDETVGIKLQWGDFGTADVPDMRIEVTPETGALLRSVGWTVQDEDKISSWNNKPYVIRNVATVPAGTEVFVLSEQDSYWRAKEQGGLLKSTGKPADDPHSVSGYRHFLPEETVVFVPEYVQAFARGIWKDGVYTTFPYETEHSRHLAWLRREVSDKSVL
jgi:hypothetical protein